jgi:HAD superfamily hydrolase (TIGR01484 family)
MRPLLQCPTDLLARVQGVLTDIDDTITTNGRLTAAAYGAMEKIRNAGMLVIPVTGRPAGWCDHIARMWPVDAVVGENGALWFRYDDSSRQMQRHFVADPDSRITHRKRLLSIAEHILREIPRARVAADQPYRESDLAIDYSEDVDCLVDADVDRIAAIMRGHGMTAKVSSIHVNGWFGNHDKLTTTLDLLAKCFGVNAARAKRTFVFVGDSPNDQPMFEYFPNSFGVANVRTFERRMSVLPTYVTRAAAGRGFAELATKLVKSRQRTGSR